MTSFNYSSHPQEILFGAGSLSRLPEMIRKFGWQKVMLITSRSMRENGRLQQVHKMLGGHLEAIVDNVQPHVQDTQLQPILAVAEESDADVVIGMGGGSAVGMAKAVVSALRKEDRYVSVAAIPVTYAGSEMTPVYGVTHTRETPPRKVTVNDPAIVPRLVIYDPELTLDLPADVTASTGINAFAHCVEALYSRTKNPLSSAAAVDGIRHIHASLLDCVQDGRNLSARSEMLLGAHLAGLSLASVSMGLHHGLCHVLGGTASVPHGVANAIVLPHVIRFNADATYEELLPAARVMGISETGLSPIGVTRAMADGVSAWVGKMRLPQRLREVGVQESDLPNLAEIAFQSKTVQNNPKPIAESGQLLSLLSAMW